MDSRCRSRSRRYVLLEVASALPLLDALKMRPADRPLVQNKLEKTTARRSGRETMLRDCEQVHTADKGQ